MSIWDQETVTHKFMHIDIASGDRGMGKRGKWIIAWFMHQGSSERRTRTLVAAAILTFMYEDKLLY